MSQSYKILSPILIYSGWNWLFWFCEAWACVSGQNQMCQWRGLKLQFFFVRWQKIKIQKGRLSCRKVGFWSVRSRSVDVSTVGLSGLPLTVSGFAKVVIFTTKLPTKHGLQIYEKLSYEALHPPLLQNPCYALVFLLLEDFKRCQYSILQLFIRLCLDVFRGRSFTK